MKEQKGYAWLISSGHNNSNIIARSYISDIAKPHDTYKKRSMSPRNRAYLAITAFKNAWTGINILVVVTIFNWLPLIANKLIFLNSQSVFQESSDVTTRVKFSQKAPPFKFIQQLFWFSLGHNKNNQAKNSECQAGQVDTPMAQCEGRGVMSCAYVGYI